MGGGDLGVGGGERLGDLALGGFDLGGGRLGGAGFDLIQQGLATGFEGFEGRLALGLDFGGFGDGPGEGDFGLGDLSGGLGVGVLRTRGGLGLVE